MALASSYVQAYGQIPEFFQTLSQGQAPDQFTSQHLKDLGFTSSNHRTLLPLLKVLGFLTAEGTPTARYHDYRDASRARQVMGDALKEAYSDLFVIRAFPSESDRGLIEGKFKSAHNATERMAKLMASTFYSLLGLADITAKPHVSVTPAVSKEDLSATAKKNVISDQSHSERVQPLSSLSSSNQGHSLHYNIQIHLPATKDIEVFNAIFRSLKEHLLD